METKEPRKTDTPKIEVTVQETDTAPLAKISPANDSAAQMQGYWDQFVLYLSKLPDFLGDFFGEYQKPLISVGLVLGALVTVRVTLAVLDSLDDIPLVSPFFELVGIGYSGWFIWRYLLKASTRQELGHEIDAIKGQVLGGNSHKV